NCYRRGRQMTYTAEGEHEAAIGYYGNYQEYNKLLRTWFVAFGIGGPVLLYTRPELLQDFTDVDRSRVVWALLIGSATQVVLAFLNKCVSWQEHNYRFKHERDLKLNRNWRELLGKWLDDQFWIDVLADLASALLFGYAIYMIAGADLRVAEPLTITPPPN